MKRLPRRDSFNATASGKANLLGTSELVDAITSGRVELDEIEEENLPASLQALAPAEQMEVIGEQAKRRDELQQEIRQLSESRSSFIEQKAQGRRRRRRFAGREDLRRGQGPGGARRLNLRQRQRQLLNQAALTSSPGCRG